MSVTVSFPDFSARREHRAGPTFRCTLHAKGAGPTWVHVAGDLGVDSAPRLAQALDHSNRAHMVILDLRDLSFLDASAVDVIVKASRHARRSRGRLMLIRPPSRFDRVLALADWANALEIFDLDAPGPPIGDFPAAKASADLGRQAQMPQAPDGLIS